MLGISSIQRALRILITCLLPFVCAVCAAQTSRIGHESEAGEKAPSNRSDSGKFFLGSSQDPEHCANAWLLYLDKENRNGEIFVVAGMNWFSDFELAEDGTLTFQWTGLGDKNYRFNGTLKSDEIAGDIQLVDSRSGKTEYLCEMTASKLPAQNVHANPEHQVLPSRYSNVYYSDEGGDLVGFDIRFFSTSKGTQGMIVFYEDSWDEPVYTPLALSQIEMVKGTIRFAARTPNGVAHYHLLTTPTGALFNRDDVAQENRRKDILLKRHRTVLPALGP
jgi:hypothetical protein